ncbi:MAG TPA: S8 family serine peptidase [Lacipirellulaceae bacterium]|nr:S8 family serine peptidase [Lacipirellulaceae bacterium]
MDGNSKLTLAVDWLANRYPNVLQVIAGNESGAAGPLPTDNYNGITVGAATLDKNGVYAEVGTVNTYDDDAFGARTSVSLLAPGEPVETGNLNNTETFVAGTSEAAPHVTGTVALLQHYAEYQATNVGAPQWTANAARHEVMKAVLINSADKLKDTGDGNLLGMEHTAVDGCDSMGNNCSTWLNSSAYTDDTIPLDIRMGAGLLNANRALKQFKSGAYGPNAAQVPAIGWDLGTTGGDDTVNVYALAQPLKANSFVSITLNWDRQVFFNVDSGTANKFDRGDTFFPDCCLAALTLYLMPAGQTDLSSAVARSISAEMNLQHIFFQIQDTQKYEIWVKQVNSSFGESTDYGLAWWTVAAATQASLGDFNGDGVVDSQDYNVWRSDFGSGNAAADANGDGVVNAADYVVWRDHLGQSVGSGAGSAGCRSRAYNARIFDTPLCLGRANPP